VIGEATGLVPKQMKSGLRFGGAAEPPGAAERLDLAGPGLGHRIRHGRGLAEMACDHAGDDDAVRAA